MDKSDWQKVLSYYSSVKEYYILCEETDPELKTNLQPLNEFRAALDHVMRIEAIEHTDISDIQNVSEEEECRKLLSHLKRAFYDISDLLSMHYRNKIIDLLGIYDSEIITKAIPNYYSEIRPNIETCSEQIATLREEKGFAKTPSEDRMEQYKTIVQSLRSHYQTIQKALPSLEELRKEKGKIKVKNRLTQIGIPVIGILAGVIAAVIGWVV